MGRTRTAGVWCLKRCFCDTILRHQRRPALIKSHYWIESNTNARPGTLSCRILQNSTAHARMVLHAVASRPLRLTPDLSRPARLCAGPLPGRVAASAHRRSHVAPPGTPSLASPTRCAPRCSSISLSYFPLARASSLQYVPCARASCPQFARSTAHLRALAARDQHADVVAVQEELAELIRAAGGEVVLGHVLEDHVWRGVALAGVGRADGRKRGEGARTDVVVEAEERAGEFLVAFHDDPDARVDALVDEFWEGGLGGGERAGAGGDGYRGGGGRSAWPC